MATGAKALRLTHRPTLASLGFFRMAVRAIEGHMVALLMSKTHPNLLILDRFAPGLMALSTTGGRSGSCSVGMCKKESVSPGTLWLMAVGAIPISKMSCLHCPGCSEFGCRWPPIRVTISTARRHIMLVRGRTPTRAGRRTIATTQKAQETKNQNKKRSIAHIKPFRPAT